MLLLVSVIILQIKRIDYQITNKNIVLYCD